MALPQRIAIVGAGIGGLTLAVALNKYIPAIQVKVFEQAPELRPKLGGAFKIDAGAATLRELGLLSEYLRESQAYNRATLVTESGSVMGSADLGEAFVRTALRNDGPHAKERPHIAGLIMRERLQAILHNALPPEDVELNKQLEIIYNTDDDIRLQFADGTEATADLVVGADGLRSTVRELAFGMQYTPEFTGYQMQYVVSRTNHLEDHTITHVIGDDMYMWVTACGPPDARYEVLARYMPYSTELPEDWNAAHRSFRDDMQEHILRLGFDPKYADMVGQAERIFNLGIYQQKHMGSWISPNQRVILMGDACHASTPFLAAGANMALEDGLCLALLLEQLASKGGSLDETLQRYQDKRKLFTEALVSGALKMGSTLIATGLHRTLNNAKLMAGIATGQLARDLVSRGQPSY